MHTRTPVAGLFLCLFAAQAAVIAMAPVLAAAAADLDVSTSTAGQLRTVTGLAAGVTALSLGAVGRRLSLRRQLIAAAMLLAAGSAASAGAGSFAVLALAQVPVGAGVAALTTASVVAAAEWSTPEARTSVLSWALTGQPAAWIVGMPILGLVGDTSWRLDWLVLPLVAAVAAALLVARSTTEPPTPRATVALRTALEDPAERRWLVSELLANAGWAGTLVYSGALFTETYGISAHVTGLLLAVGASGYVAGNLLSRRLARDPAPSRLALLALCLAAAVALFGVERPSPLVSTVVFSLAAACAGARTLVASAFGLAVAPERRASLTSLRAATMQFGYFIGAIAGGIALAAHGYGALGLTLSGLFVLAAAALLVAWPDTRARRLRAATSVG